MVATETLKNALLDGAREVFETMLFMALEEAEDPRGSVEDVACLATITFKGSLEGCLGIGCGPACARTIATNMLGMDPGTDLAVVDVNDAIGEVANMVMGGVKSRVQGEIGPIEVSIPSVFQGRQIQHALGDRAREIALNVTVDEAYPARLSLLYRENGS